MKNALIAVVFAALTSTTHASKQTDCELVGEVARAVMTARQVGVPMSRVMQLADGERLIELAVEDAYTRPRFQSESMRREAVIDFRNEWEARCFASRSGRSVR